MKENKKKRNTGFLRWAIALMVIAAVMTFLVSPASAQNYPTKPLVLIVPFSPGGGSDVAARVIAQYVQPHLGQAIVVENKPGAAGQVGWSALAKAQPDGYTLGLCQFSLHPPGKDASGKCPLSDVGLYIHCQHPA